MPERPPIMKAVVTRVRRLKIVWFVDLVSYECSALAGNTVNNKPVMSTSTGFAKRGQLEVGDAVKVVRRYSNIYGRYYPSRIKG